MDLIKEISLVTNLSKGAIEFIQKNIEVFSYKKGNTILQDGEVCNYLYFITTGMLRGYYYSEAKEITNWVAIENDFATSFYSFISRKRSYENVEALEESIVEALSYNKLRELYSLFPETEKVGRIILENYYLRLEERVISIQFKSAKERYDSFFENRPEVIRRAPLGCIASYLGITQETLSRIRAKL